MNSFAVTVPMPPSINKMFATNFRTRRRFPAKAYGAWRETAGGIVKRAWEAAGEPKFEGPLQLVIHLGLRFDADIANRIKPLEDLLVKAIPDFPDDCWNDRIEIERVPEVSGARLLVTQLRPREIA